jgi:hypothetical protein
MRVLIFSIFASFTVYTQVNSARLSASIYRIIIAIDIFQIAISSRTKNTSYQHFIYFKQHYWLFRKHYY